MEILKKILSTRPTRIEHFIHLLVTMGTGGVWVLFWLARILIFGLLSPDKKSTFDSSFAPIHKSGKVVIGEYSKRSLITEEEIFEDEYGEYADPYSFEAVGESHHRQAIISILREHNAMKLGELFVEAIMQKEPQNEFDEDAVAIYVNDKKVGYVDSGLSWEVSKYLTDRKLDGIRVKAVFGWDTSNPSPPIGLRVDFNF
jgi:hypothetical protein